MTNLATLNIDRATQGWARTASNEMLHTELARICRRMGALVKAGREFQLAQKAASYRAIRSEMQQRRA